MKSIRGTIVGLHFLRGGEILIVEVNKTRLTFAIASCENFAVDIRNLGETVVMVISKTTVARFRGKLLPLVERLVTV